MAGQILISGSVENARVTKSKLNHVSNLISVRRPVNSTPSLSVRGSRLVLEDKDSPISAEVVSVGGLSSDRHSSVKKWVNFN